MILTGIRALLGTTAPSGLHSRTRFPALLASTTRLSKPQPLAIASTVPLGISVNLGPPPPLRSARLVTTALFGLSTDTSILAQGESIILCMGRHRLQTARTALQDTTALKAPITLDPAHQATSVLLRRSYQASLYSQRGILSLVLEITQHLQLQEGTPQEEERRRSTARMPRTRRKGWISVLHAPRDTNAK